MEQSREEFEAWFRGWIDEHMADSCWPDVSLKELAEMSWQASKAAPVTLPSYKDYPLSAGTAAIVIADCKKAIEAQGLTVK